MGRRIGIGIIAALAVLATVPASAQIVERRVVPPISDRSMNAVGGMAGVSLSGDDTLTNGLTLGALAEHYFTPRVSVRGELSGAWWNIANAGPNNSVSPVSFAGNFVYNWDRGLWRPYATVGLGIYKYRFTENDVDSSDTRLSFNLGGGIEFFVRRHDAVTGEVLFHPLVGTVQSVNTSYTPWYWSISGGYKKYF